MKSTDALVEGLEAIAQSFKAMKDISVLQTQISELKQTKAGLQSANDVLTAQNSEVVDNINKTSDAVTKAVSDAKARADQFITDAKTQASQITVIAKNQADDLLNIANQQLGSLAAQADAIQSQITAKRNELSDVQSQVTAVKSELAQIKAKLN